MRTAKLVNRRKAVAAILYCASGAGVFLQALITPPGKREVSEGPAMIRDALYVPHRAVPTIWYGLHRSAVERLIEIDALIDCQSKAGKRAVASLMLSDREGDARFKLLVARVVAERNHSNLFEVTFLGALPSSTSSMGIRVQILAFLRYALNVHGSAGFTSRMKSAMRRMNDEVLGSGNREFARYLKNMLGTLGVIH